MMQSSYGIWRSVCFAIMVIGMVIVLVDRVFAQNPIILGGLPTKGMVSEDVRCKAWPDRADSIVRAYEIDNEEVPDNAVWLFDDPSEFEPFLLEEFNVLVMDGAVGSIIVMASPPIDYFAIVLYDEEGCILTPVGMFLTHQQLADFYNQSRADGLVWPEPKTLQEYASEPS